MSPGIYFLHTCCQKKKHDFFFYKYLLLKTWFIKKCMSCLDAVVGNGHQCCPDVLGSYCSKIDQINTTWGLGFAEGSIKLRMSCQLWVCFCCWTFEQYRAVQQMAFGPHMTNLALQYGSFEGLRYKQVQLKCTILMLWFQHATRLMNRKLLKL